MHRDCGKGFLIRASVFALVTVLLAIPAGIMLFPTEVQASAGVSHTIQNDSLTMEIGDLGQIITMNIINNPDNRENQPINFVGSTRSWGENAQQNDAQHQWMGEMIFSTRSAATEEGLAEEEFTEVDTNKTLAAGGSTTATNIAQDNAFFKKEQVGQEVSVTFNGGDDPEAGARRMQGFKVDSSFNAETEDGSVVWEITLTNKDDANFIEFGDIGLPMTWNNKYRNTADTYNNRLTVHSFAGADSGYYYGIRTSGEGNYMMFTPVPQTGAKIEYVEQWKRNFNGQTGTLRQDSANWTGDGGAWYPGLSVAYIHSKSIRERDGASYFKSEDSSSLILAPGESKTYQFKFSAVRAGDNEPGESAQSPQNASSSVEERETNHRSILYNEGLIDAVAAPSFQTAINMPTKIDLHYDQEKIRNVVVDIQSVYENDPFDEDHIPNQNAGRVSNARGGLGLEGAYPEYERSATLVETKQDERGEWRHIYDLQFDTIGNNSVHVDYQLWDGTEWVDKVTQFEFNVLAQIDEAIDVHADFMANNQQDNDPESPEYGIYDDWYITGGIDTNRGHWGDDWSHDNVDFMVMKNYLNPDKEQIESLERYLIDFMWNNYMKFTQDTYRVANYLSASGVYTASANPYQRDFSEVMEATAFFNMYRIQKAYPTLMNYRESRLWYLEKAFGIANQAGAGTTGFYGEQQFPDIIEALYDEGMTAQAESLKARFAQTKGSRMAAAEYPYGSEFEYDNTGEEGAYTANKALLKYYPDAEIAARSLSQMDKMDWKTRAMRGLQPTWFHYADPVFRGGEGWWNFQYTASLAGYIMDDWLRYQNDTNQYDNDSRAWAERMNYGAKISNFNAINMGQISDRSIGGVSWRYTMTKGNFGAQNVNDGGTRLMSNGWNDFSGESDEGIYGSLLSISTDVVTDPIFGLFAYGGTVSKADGAYTVVPKDGIGKRLNFLDEMLYITAESDSYAKATVSGDASLIELEMNNIARHEHMSKFVFYGLNDGFYGIEMNSESAGQFYVENGEGVAYVSVGEDESFTVAFKEIEGGSAAPATVEVISQFEETPAKRPFYFDGLVYNDGFYDIESYAWDVISAPEGGGLTFEPANIQMPTATATAAGEYTVRFTVVIGGTQYEATKSVTVTEALATVPPVIGDADYSISGNVVDIFAEVTLGDKSDREISYAWSVVSAPENAEAVIGETGETEIIKLPGVPGIAQRTSVVMTVTSAGAYVVKLTATDDDVATEKEFTIEVTGDTRPSAIAVVTEVGQAPNLPETVEVFGEGGYRDIDVTWDEIESWKYERAGQLTVNGSVPGTDIETYVKVYVVEDVDPKVDFTANAATDGIFQTPNDMGGYAAMQRADTPTASNNAGVQQAWHNWQRGQDDPAYVIYTWDEPRLMDQTQVYVFRDNNGNFQPKNFKLQVRDENGAWYTPRDLDENDLGNALNQFNVTTFEPAYITGMRLDMEPMTHGSGIARWWAFGYGAKTAAEGENIALVGERGASFTSDWESLPAINNGGVTTGSGHWGSWGHNSDSEWVSYSWPEGAVVTGDNLWIWSDGGGIHIPQSITYEYLPLVGDEWITLAEYSGDAIKATYSGGSYPNPHIFDTTEMRGLRVTFYEQDNAGNGFGLVEWQVFGELIESQPKDSVTFTYGGEEADAIVPGATLDVNAVLEVPGDAAVTMFAALYSETGRLLKLAQIQGEIEDGSASFTGGLDIPQEISDGASVKVFFWTSEAFAPIREVTEFK